ncbi:GEVED domain-containing protein, partial [Planctomycetota bacterium]
LNDDGDWDDAYEHRITDRYLPPGVSQHSFHVPSTATITERTFARFRFSSSAGLSYDGPAPDGEVEDYAVPIGTPGLTLTIGADWVSESAGAAATTATVTRNIGTVGDLVVTMANDDPSKATVPARVTIPHGMSSVTFDVDAVDDAIGDGTQTVTLTATHHFSVPLERDSTYGTDGGVTASGTTLNALAVQPDGTVVGAGYFTRGESGNNYDFRVLRCNPDGSLDTTFGDGGVVTSDLAGESEQAQAVGVQDDGKIVAAGMDWVVRYNVDGVLDPTFDADGIAPPTVAEVYDLAILPDGKILVAGEDGSGRFALARYNSDGTPDATFGTAGMVTTDFPGSGERAHALALQADGKIVLAGNGASPFSGAFLLARYQASGELDPTFGIDGKVTTGLPGNASDLVIQPDGKIIVAGGTGDFYNDATLVRYETDGALDTTFGVDGVAIHPGYGALTAVALQPNGEIVVSGFTFLQNWGGVARYHTDGAFDSFGPFSAFGFAMDLAVLPSGGVIVGGQGSGDVVLERFHATEMISASDGIDVTDDDSPGVHVSESGGDTQVAEGGATDTYTVVLTSEPTHDVHVVLDPDTQLGVAPVGPLVFTPADWDSAQTVTVSAVDDDVAEGAHTGAIVHTASSTDPAYDGIAVDSVTANIDDNDTAGVTILETGGDTAVVEGGATDSYHVLLTSQPTHNVHVLLDPDTQVGVAPAGPLVFTPADWDSAQTVTVSAVDDDVVEGPHTGTILHTASSADPIYNGIAVDSVTANVGDNDTAGVSILEPGGDTAVVEGGATDTYHVVLTSQPAHDVHVVLNPDTQVGVAPAGPLVFTPANWDSAQTVTVSAVDDDMVEGVHTGTIVHAASSADPVYSWIAVDSVTAYISDNDTAGVAIFETGGDTEVVEGGATDTYHVLLTSQPMHDVYVLLDPDVQVGVAPAGPLVFTPADWDSAQTVTVSAVDDDVVEGPHTGTIVHTASSTDPVYSGIAVDSVTTNIDDNDTAGVTVHPILGLTTTEAGGTDTFTIVLHTQPTAHVTIGLDSSDTTEGTVPGGVTFTPANWATAQTVTVTGQDDDVDDGDAGYTILTAPATITNGSDTNYEGLNAADVSVTNQDNDTAGVTVHPILGLTTTEAGGTDTFTIVLDTQPTAHVTIGLSSSDTTEGTVPGGVTFT